MVKCRFLPVGVRVFRQWGNSRNDPDGTLLEMEISAGYYVYFNIDTDK